MAPLRKFRMQIVVNAASNRRHDPRPSDRNLDVPELAAPLPELMSQAANGPVAPPEVARCKYAHGNARPLSRYKRYARD
jgi:hypothetical protein